jgi:hypothetical protein
MKSTPLHPGNRFICTSGVFCHLRFSVFVGVLALGFSILFCTPVMAQTSPAAPSVGSLAPMESVDSLVDEASRRFSIPALWIRSVMQVESGSNAQALSPKGAIGLMQIMPETYAALRQAFGLGADPYQPRDNIIAGAAYLRQISRYWPVFHELGFARRDIRALKPVQFVMRPSPELILYRRVRVVGIRVIRHPQRGAGLALRSGIISVAAISPRT